MKICCVKFLVVATIVTINLGCLAQPARSVYEDDYSLYNSSYQLDYYDDYFYEEDSIFSKWETSTVVSDFKEEIEKKEKLEDYKTLRNYKSKKESKLREISDAVKESERTILSARNRFQSKRLVIGYRKKLISDASDFLNSLTSDKVDTTSAVLRALRLYGGTITKSQIQKAINGIRTELKSLSEQREKDSLILSRATKIHENILKSRASVESDLENCIATIDNAIAPEYKEQTFRKQISIAFSLLIGVLIMAFFLIVYFKSDNNIASVMLSDGGLQFVTIFVLIIAVILFGILSILHSNELSAILSGIAGYILGKSGKVLVPPRPN